MCIYVYIEYAHYNVHDVIITDIFVGQLKSELKFDECGHRSVTFDPFWDLSLPVSRVSVALKIFGNDLRKVCEYTCSILA